MTAMPPSETDAYYRQLCEHLGVAVIAADVGLKIRTWNDAAARMFGAAAEQMINTPVVSIIPQERRKAAERLLERAMETGETLPFEFQHRDAQGKRRELAATIAPVVSESGAVIGASACIRDITRRIAAESELYETRKMAALGELAGAVAHHFNNILGGVITSVDYAGISDDPDVMQRVLKQTGRALLRATRLVNSLLAFSEGYQRSDDLSDFTELVVALTDDIECQIKGRGIELKTDIQTLSVLPVPRVQVTTILRNIVQNAIEAMPNGGTLSIKVSLEDDWVVTEISDTGCGFDESARSHIFEPFWSTKGARTATSGEVIGLGLTVAHGLVKVIGGRISVISEPGKGSSFKVYIPRAPGQ